MDLTKAVARKAAVEAGAVTAAPSVAIIHRNARTSATVMSPATAGLIVVTIVATIAATTAATAKLCGSVTASSILQ